MSHASVAKSVREDKERNPQNFCPVCLWRTTTRHGYNPCRKHPRECADRVAKLSSVFEAPDLPANWGRLEAICTKENGHGWLPDAPTCGCGALKRTECSCPTCGDRHFTGEITLTRNS